MKRHFLYIFLLIFIMGFLIWPKIGLAEISPEDIIKNQDKIEFKEKDVESIFRSFTQGLVDKWMELPTPEGQSVLIILSQAIKVEAMNYLLVQIPKEIGKVVINTTIDVIRLILTKDLSIIINKIEKISVEEAKEYLMDLLLQNEIRVGKGNLKEISYPTYAGGWQKVIFPYIIVYHPLSLNSGEVGINIYSAKTIKTPAINLKYQWEGGIEELPPFIVKVNGKVEKVWVGLGFYYDWIEGPNIDVVFNEPVPNFEFEEPGFFDKLKSYLDKTKKAFENLLDLIGIFSSKLNIFQATVGPSSTLVPSDLPSDWQEDEQEEVINPEIIEEIGKKIEEVEERGETGSPSELELEKLQEVLDDVAEKIDILSQKVAELVGEAEGIGGPIEPIEELEEEEIEELEEKEEKEDTEKKEGGICVVNINTASKEELQKLTGVGPVIAQKIIDARPFSSIYNLIKISGIGEITLQKIIDQGCAYVEHPTGGGGGGGGGESAQPKITLSYSENNPVNKEIEITLSLADFKNALYDVKISIEKEGKVLSDIYNENKSEWQSSFNYLPEVFSNTSFSGDFKLKIKDAENSFRGEADIIVRIRESGKTKYSEFIGKINLTEPESEPDATPTLEVSLQSLEFSIVEFTTPSQSQTFTISNSGEGSLEWQGIIEYTSPSDADWLEIEPDSGTAPSEVSVSLSQDIFSLGKGNYEAEIVISAEGAGGTPKKIGVELEVEAKSEPEPEPEPEPEQPLLTVVINEIAWMGTKANSADEWLELYNTTDEEIDLTNWTLKSSDGSPEIIFGENSENTIIPAKGFYLLERTDDNTINDISADWYGSFGYGLKNNPDCEILSLYDQNGNLIDKTTCFENGDWPAGKASPDYISMERIDAAVSGSVPQNWADNNFIIAQQGLDAEGNLINGTPRAKNSSAFLGKIIYVDDDFEDDPVNHRWNTIQKGIDDAGPDYLVLVNSGIYQGNVIIEKQLILRGTGDEKNPTLASGILVKVNGVTIEGFELKNTQAGIHLLNSNKNILKNNVFEENSYGIYLENSQNNTLIKNTINSKHYSWHGMTCGIYLSYSDNNIIRKNQANDRGESTAANGHGPSNGICLISSDNNIIENNTSQNNKGTGDGIYLKDSDSNQLEDNFSTENQIGINLINSNGNSLKNNKTEDNNFGIYFDLNSNENILKNNLMDNNCIANLNVFSQNNEIDESNLVDGKAVYYLQNQSDLVIDSSLKPGLVYCFNCQNITIKDLTIDSRNNTGIYFYRTNDSLIENVNISESIVAIYLEESNNNTIKESVIKKNFRGISLLKSERNKVLENILEENDSQGYSPCFGTSPRFGLSLSQSGQNEISNNLITNNPTGVELVSYSGGNILFENTIENNNNGINVYCSSNNLFYHNNFINNEKNEWGSCTLYPPGNQWYHLDLNQGNYYSDYNELEEGCNDLDNDNICDACYPKNNDKYPFLQKSGWLNK